MNTARLLRIAAVCVLTTGTTVLARDIKTVNGDVYKNITITKQDPTGLQISHDDGIAFLDFRVLGPAEQKEFGYDPTTYTAAWKQKVEVARAQQQALAAQKAAADATKGKAQPTPSPIYTQDVPRPPAVFTNQTGLQFTVDSPGFRYGPYDYTGRSFSNTIPPNQGGPVPYPYTNGGTNVNPNPYYGPYPNPYYGPTWGPTIIRQR